MKRYFIALNLPLEIKTVFKNIQDSLIQQNSDVKITWVDPHIAHINLHFLGDLSENEQNHLKQNLMAIKGKYGPISLALTGTGAFPSKENPRVLFLGVKHTGENNLITLYSDIAEILKKQSLQTEDRPFIAHITLGRIKENNNKIKFSGEEMPDIEFKINSFELMTSVLTPDGPDYQIVESYNL
ncbi:MAG: RNA 2',3'-cyclic phosphodiesterase [Patescibacteria group bacterium]